MNRRLLLYWQAYYELEPTLPERLDILLPKLTADVINLLRDPESPPVTLDQVMIDWAADPPPPVEYSETVADSEQQMADLILAAFS